MNPTKVIALMSFLVSSITTADEVVDNANIGWVEAKCVAIANLEPSGFNGAKAEQLAARAKARLSSYYNQVQAKTISTEQAGKIGGNLRDAGLRKSNSEEFYYSLIGMYTEDIQEDRERANYKPNTIEYDFYYGLRWINGGCDALLALDK